MRNANGYGGIKKLSGKRRRPWMVTKTAGWEYDEAKDKMKQKIIVVGYAETKAKAQELLAEYNQNPYDVNAAKITFSEVFEKWSKTKYPTVSESNVKGYNASYRACSTLYNKIFKDIKLADLQYVIDSCGKNYPTLKKIKVLFNQLYNYALKNEICNKDYSQFVDVLKYKDRNPNKRSRDRFSNEDIAKIWGVVTENRYYQIPLMLIYSGCRISELLDLKKENVNLEEQYFDVIVSKTENGIRRVPIPDLLLPYYREWYENSECEYLLHTMDQKHLKYRNYYDAYWTPLMDSLGLTYTPHFTRHTCISLLSDAHVDPTIIKKIVGHSGAMTLTERVYTHLDVNVLIEAINKIVKKPE